MQTNKMIRTVVITAVFTALAAALGLVKIPSPVGSIALDSAPGFFCAAFFNPIVGAVVGALGHVASASTAGFPLGPLHVYVAIEMFIWCLVFGLIARASKSIGILIAASIVALILNGVIGPYILVYTPVASLPKDVVRSLLPFLLLASALNIIFAAVAYRTMRKVPLNQMS